MANWLTLIISRRPKLRPHPELRVYDGVPQIERTLEFHTGDGDYVVKIWRPVRHYMDASMAANADAVTLANARGWASPVSLAEALVKLPNMRAVEVTHAQKRNGIYVYSLVAS